MSAINEFDNHMRLTGVATLALKQLDAAIGDAHFKPDCITINSGAHQIVIQGLTQPAMLALVDFIRDGLGDIRNLMLQEMTEAGGA